VTITEAGRAMLEQGLPLYDDIVARSFGSLSNDELAGFEAAIVHLDKIVDDLEEEAGFRRGRLPALKAEERD
jgi:DNA-binding MarR family transcriptional regulator